MNDVNGDSARYFDFSEDEDICYCRSKSADNCRELFVS